MPAESPRETQNFGLPGAWLAYGGLWSLAFAKPIFDTIASGPEALTNVGAGRLDILGLILLLVVMPPTVAVGFEWLLHRFFPALALPFRAGVLGILAGLIVWQWLTNDAVSSPVRELAPLLLAAGFAVGYLRLELIRSFATILAIAIPVVVISFCLGYPVKDELLPGAKAAAHGEAKGDAPVVLVVFDELSAPFLEDPDGRIDAHRYPNFARLSHESTWYRNTRSVAGQTLYALPAIMTGTRAPDVSPAKPAGSRQYPDNLCHILEEGGYSLDTFEPITNFCPSSFSLRTRLTDLLDRGTQTRLTPKEIPAHLMNLIARGDSNTLLKYEADPGARLVRFADELEATPRSFNLLHVGVPHYPWRYLPDGASYPPPVDLGFTNEVWSDHPAQVESAAQRMALQLGFVDTQLGRIIDRLKADRQWKDAMVVITADHGLHFGASESRRMLAAENSGQILSPPLFIKYPGQTEGKTVKSPAYITDIAPTILDVTGVDPGDELEGESLRSPESRSRSNSDSFPAQGISGEFTVDGKDLQRQKQTARRLDHKLFGSGSFFALGGSPRLLGQPVSKVRQRLEPLVATPTDPAALSDMDPAGPLVNAAYDATLEGPALKPGRDRVAIAVNGRIAATTRAWMTGLEPGQWKVTIVLPPRYFKDGLNHIKVFAIGS